MKPCVIVHGGAYNIADIFVERYKSGTKSAAKAGYDVLKKVLCFVSLSVTTVSNVSLLTTLLLNITVFSPRVVNVNRWSKIYSTVIIRSFGTSYCRD